MAVPAISAAGLYIAQQRGYFTAAGLHVTIKSVASGVDAIPNLVNGVSPVAPGRVADLMQSDGLLAKPVNTAALVKELITR